MAKEFTPSKCSVQADARVEGIVQPHLQRPLPEAPPSTRVFSAAVGSEVKSAALEQPYRATVQRHPPKLLGQPGSASTPQPAIAMALGDGGQNPRHQPGGTAWPIRATTLPARPGPPMPSHIRLTASSQGHRSSPPGFSPRVIHQRTIRAQSQGSAVSPGPLPQREVIGPTKYQGGKGTQHADGTWDQTDRASSSNAGSQFVSLPHAGRPQRRNRYNGSLAHVQSQGQTESRVRITAKTGSSAGRDRFHDETSVHRQRADQDPAKASSQNRVHGQQSVVRRVLHDPTNSPGDTLTKDSPKRQGVLTEGAVQSAGDSRRSSGGDEHSPRSASSLFPVESGQKISSRQASARLSSVIKQEVPHTEDAASAEDGEPSLAAIALSNHPSGRWTGNGERGTRPAKPEEDPAGHVQSLLYKEKEKEKARSKKKEDKAYRPGPKQLLGTGGKEPSKAKIGTRSSVWQRTGLLGPYVRNLSLGLVAAVLRTITRQLNRSGDTEDQAHTALEILQGRTFRNGGRLRLVGRLLAVLSFLASSGISLLSMAIMSMSWLFFLGLRVHSLALKEATGSIHIAVCFVFPYCFQYLVSVIDEWAPHWLPACLWYSFLMQMFCTSNHQYKHSMSSHLVPALRALLPVAFLCEVPSGRSYLLALGGSELLLLSFTLAAVRLRCLFSPIFLLSWSSQVFAIASCGSSASLQYGQLLISLASLHAVSMVDVMLNSRFYHARYRAGMSLTHGFRAISSPSNTLLR